VALPFCFSTIFLLNVELSEEVEGNDGVEIDYDARQHYREYQLKNTYVIVTLAVVNSKRTIELSYRRTFF